MGPWGPYDYSAPAAFRSPGNPGGPERWTVLGAGGPLRIGAVRGPVEVELEAYDRERDRTAVRVGSARPGTAAPYRVELTPANGSESGAVGLEGALVDIEWSARLFPWSSDPRDSLQDWRRESRSPAARELRLGRLELPLYELDGAGALAPVEDVPGDRFGLIAAGRIELPAGRWRVRTVSDDGVRVAVDGEVIVERWDQHGPTPDEARIELERSRVVELEVEYFELDGAQTLRFELRPESVPLPAAPEPPPR